MLLSLWYLLVSFEHAFSLLNTQYTYIIETVRWVSDSNGRSLRTNRQKTAPRQTRTGKYDLKHLLLNDKVNLNHNLGLGF